MLNSFCTEEQRFVHLSLNFHRVEFCSEITSYVAEIFQNANLNTQHASQEKRRRACYRKLFKIGIFLLNRVYFYKNGILNGEYCICV